MQLSFSLWLQLSKQIEPTSYYCEIIIRRSIIITDYLRMGASNHQNLSIHELQHHLSLLKQSPGQKLLINKRTHEEYSLIMRLVQKNDNSIINTLQARKKISSKYIPSLIQYRKEGKTYCSDTEILQIMFKRPSKSILEEIADRRQVGQWFEEGEAMMVAYCALLALKSYAQIQNYEITVDENSLFIGYEGEIVLSDTGKYRDHFARKSTARKGSEGKNCQKAALSQLGIVLDHLQKGSKEAYSISFKKFITLLIKAQVEGYENAINLLQNLKRQNKVEIKQQLTQFETQRPKQNKFQVQRIKQTENKKKVLLEIDDIIEQASKGAKINLVQVDQLIKMREPLNSLDQNISHSNKSLSKTQGISSLCYESAKSKPKKHQIYKSQFQACKTQAFLQNPLQQRIDEMSSIHERPSRIQEKEESEVSNNTFSFSELQDVPLHIPPIQLFLAERPERLKQLVLNQKGIIYEQSDQISSLASGRTHNRFASLQID